MAAISSQGSNFTYLGFPFQVTRISVEAKTPEIVDVTPPTAVPAAKFMLATGGAVSPGRIEVECFGFVDPNTLAGTVGALVFTKAGVASISLNAICESASLEGQVDDVFRIRMNFVTTDYPL